VVRLSGAQLGRLVGLCLIGVLALSTPAALHEVLAQTALPNAGGDQPSLITADSITYDETLGIVTARGSVEISQDDRVLVADTISYNTNTDVVIATGNVALLEPSGDVVFADYMEVTGDLREGFVRDIRILMADQSRMAAVSGVRTGGDRTELSKTVYSPCDLCKQDPTRAPLWQLKADRVVWDQTQKTVTYRDAWLEFFGVPVFYTPYFQHPDPTVKRQTGFLAPGFGNSEQLGAQFEIPYFIVLSDTSDVTLTPIITTKQGVVGLVEYRQLFETGYLELEGSATVADIESNNSLTKEDRFRGHIRGDGRWDIDETYRWGFRIDRTTDDTYLRVYNFGSASKLTSRLYAEGFDGRSYGGIQAITYQGLRIDDDNDQEPIILPLADYNYVSEPGQWGGVFRFDANLLSMLRIEGRDTRRLSMAGAWTLPYTARSGEIYTLTARLQADGYWTSDYDPNDPDAVDPVNGDDQFAGRIFPELALQWRYPWVRQTGSMRQVIEPIVQVRLAPPGMNPDEIPNEDSPDVEFDDTNLFALNRFSGIDRVDPGPRLDYGIKWTALSDFGGYTSIFVGQSYRPITEDVFGPGTGLQDNFSDIVGHLQVSPAAWLDASYRFRIAEDNFSFTRHEVNLYAGIPELNLQVGYLFSDSVLSSEDSSVVEDREEIYLRLSSQFTEHWSAFVSHRHDLEDSLALTTRAGLQYRDECFTIEGIYERTNFRDREVEPDNAFFVRIVLRNLGEIAVD